MSGSCLENIVSYMYSGVLCVTPDTVNILLVVATQLEISSLVELCESFIANPDSSAEKERAVCISEDKAQDHVVSEVTHMHKPAIKVEKENSAVDNVTTSPVCPSSVPVHTTRSFSRKLQAIESSKTTQVTRSTNHEQTGRRKRRNSLDTCAESSPPKRSSKVTDASCSVAGDTDWKPISQSPVHRYNTRKHSNPTVDKPVSLPDVSTQNMHQKHSLSLSQTTPPDQQPPASAVTDLSMASAAVYGLPAWQRSRRLVLAARVCLAKQIKVADDGLLQCRQCPVEAFVSRSRLTAHVLRRHKQWRSCFTCHQQFASFLALNRHSYAKHRHFPYMRSSVSLCKKESESSSSTAHSLHNKCGWCGLKFAARSKLIEHREAVHRKRNDVSLASVCRRVVRDWSCSEKDCSMKFKHKDKLRLHMAEHHPTVIFSCPECRFKTQLEHILRRYCCRYFSFI